MKNNKKIIVVVSVLILIVGIVLAVILAKNQNNPESVLQAYVEKINTQKYEEMYEMISITSKESTSQEDFVKRNKNIYEGIEVNNIQIQIEEVEKKENKQIEIQYKTTMGTVAGNMEFSNTANLVKEEKEYKIVWNSSLIFPEFSNEDKVRVSTLEAERGKILDRNDFMLAGKGTVSSIGFVPGKMSENKTEDIAKVASILNISEDFINKQLSASYVKDDTFVPLKTVAKTETELKQNVLKVKGIKITDASERVYPLGEATSHLVGYVQNISAEELEQNKDKGYTAQSVIGKSGLEKIYEDRLKGTNGAEIYIVDSKGNKKKTLAKQDLKNGEDIKITIDAETQKSVYEQFKEDKSASVVMDSKTGEILALVSTPTFDSNDFAMGITNEEWSALTENENTPLYNRYLSTWAPGSSFKPVVGAIGLTTNKFSADENFGRSGRSWQKDDSWGDYKITTLKEYGDNVNLKNALINSDNIYFAKAALKIGKDTLKEELSKIGFGKDFAFEQALKKSQISSSGEFETEVQLADSGYGQGEVLVNPVHMAAIYSAFTNEGNMLKPYLEYKKNSTPEYVVENAFSKEAAKTIKEDLIQVVESPEGTAHSAKIQGLTIAGKTGTAEIKATKDDTTGTEIGWFNAFTVNSDKNLLIISMVEDVKDRGGSHYLLPKVKTILSK